jgi:CheY-like chemotaxis protein
MTHEAIRVIAGCDFDAIVLDLMMPKVDGFEVIEHLERTVPDRLRRSPFWAVSTAKPFRVRTVVSKVRMDLSSSTTKTRGG